MFLMFLLLPRDHMVGLIESNGIHDLVAGWIQQGHSFQAIGALHTKPRRAMNN